MITLHSGTPSSGKSYDAIKEAYGFLQAGKWVIANFPLKFTADEIAKGLPEKFYYWPNNEITVDNLCLFALEKGMIEAREEHQCKVIYDEAGGKYNPRAFQSADRMEWIQFFSQHAKLGFDFILIAQSDRMIDKQIRVACIEFEQKYRKVNNFGIFWLLSLVTFTVKQLNKQLAKIKLPKGRKLQIPIRLTLFIKIRYWYTAKERESSWLFWYRQKWADRYDRFRMFDGFQFNETIMEKIREYQVKWAEDCGGFSRVPEKIGPSAGDTPMGAIFNGEAGEGE